MCAPNYFNGADESSVRLAEKRKIPSALWTHYRHGFCLPLGQQLRKLQPQTTEAFVPEQHAALKFRPSNCYLLFSRLSLVRAATAIIKTPKLEHFTEWQQISCVK
jgi:hypothetical protein